MLPIPPFRGTISTTIGLCLNNLDTISSFQSTEAIVLAALGQGEIILKGALWSEDTEAMVDCMKRTWDLRILTCTANGPWMDGLPTL